MLYYLYLATLGHFVPKRQGPEPSLFALSDGGII